MVSEQTLRARRTSLRVLSFTLVYEQRPDVELSPVHSLVRQRLLAAGSAGRVPVCSLPA